MSSVAVAPRARKSFSRLKHVLDLPNLIDIQKASFDWFMEAGLRETIDDISPIEDYTGTLAVEFGEYEFGEPQFTIQESREKDLTYQVPLSITVRFVNKETGEIREQRVFMGDFPMMTPRGTFVINGTERVIVTQLVRSPGAYLMEPKDPTKQVFMANLMPSRGSWLEVEIDKKGIVFARIDRKRKLPITTLLRALPAEDPTTGFELDTTSNEKILELFGGSVYIANTLEKDPSTREEEALIEVFKKQRPGEPPTLDNARNLLRALFFDPKRYDLTKVGRYKLNRRLNLEGSTKDTRHLSFSLADSGLTYEAGDALGVMPANCPRLVTELLAALGCTGEEAVQIAPGVQGSLRHALASHCDITRIPLELLRAVATRTQDPHLVRVAAPEAGTNLAKRPWPAASS